MAEKRRYELKQRAERLGETRRRITEATVELHRTVGPAATQISEVARRAGVQRVTVYNHFPDEESLFSACSAHWLALHPPPDPTRWLERKDLGERLRVGLRELYGWFRETEPMTKNILRDAELVPALGLVLERGLGTYLETIRRILTEPVGTRGRRRLRVDAAVRVAVSFHAWQELAVLGDTVAADLASGFVELAADGRARRAR